LVVENGQKLQPVLGRVLVVALEEVEERRMVGTVSRRSWMRLTHCRVWSWQKSVGAWTLLTALPEKLR
jgi:hypothetical protein